MPRKSYTAKEKLEILKYADDCKSNRKAAKRYGCNESNIHAWHKKRTSLQELPVNKRAEQGAAPKFPVIEVHVLSWVKERRMAGIGVSTKDIRVQAKKFARSSGIPNFIGSIGWCRRFMKWNL